LLLHDYCFTVTAPLLFNEGRVSGPFHRGYQRAFADIVGRPDSGSTDAHLANFDPADILERLGHTAHTGSAVHAFDAKRYFPHNYSRTL